jgi:N6-adenosine-specific RNA methylase IME4
MIFPELSETEYNDLVEDLKQHGLRETIKTYKGKVVDGKNRLRACRDAGVTPRFEEWNGEGSLIAYVVSLNLKRRHLTADQKAAIAVSLLPLLEEEAKERVREHGGTAPGKQKTPVSKIPQVFGKSRDQAAKIVGVNPHYVSDFKKIQETRPELAEKIRKGEVKIVEAKRELKREQLGIVSPLPEEKFSIIYADPPWKYDFAQSNSRAIETHYPSMDMTELCALPVNELAADNSVLFLWVTAPKLWEGLQLINAWGFTYRTGGVWVKDKIGMGYYFRSKHEHLLIGTKGNPPLSDPSKRPPSVIEAPRTEHSEKPAVVYEIIEQMYPSFKKIELFARKAREGWTAWGNKVNAS